MTSEEFAPQMWKDSGGIVDYRTSHQKQIHDWESEGGSLGLIEEESHNFS